MPQTIYFKCNSGSIIMWLLGIYIEYIWNGMVMKIQEFVQQCKVKSSELSYMEALFALILDGLQRLIHPSPTHYSSVFT